MPIVVPDFDASLLNESEVRAAVATVRDAQRRLEGALAHLVARADELAAAGEGAPAEEVLLGAGEVRASTARAEAVRARTVAGVPGLAAAVAAGAVGGDHVDVIARRLGSLDERERDRVDAGVVVADAARLPVDTFDAALRRTVDELSGEARVRDHQAVRAASGFRHWFDHRTGLGRFAGQLDPERYEALTTAIDHHLATLAAGTGDGPVTKDAGLAAEALVELVCTTGERRWRPPHLVVVTDHHTLRSGAHSGSVIQTGDGYDLPAETLARVACDATVRRVTTDRDVPVGTGRRFRTATDPQWDTLRAMYASCAWVGCDRPVSWCQAHHILEWKHGGEGELENLVPLCSRHHHAVHEGKWSIRLRPDRALDIWRPDGAHHASTDPPTRRRSETAAAPPHRTAA